MTGRSSRRPSASLGRRLNFNVGLPVQYGHTAGAKGEVERGLTGSVNRTPAGVAASAARFSGARYLKR